MREPGLECELKEQLARELCAIFRGYQRDIAAAHVDADASELSRIRHGDLRRFSLTRIVRYIARAGYDIEVHLKDTAARESSAAAASSHDHSGSIRLLRQQGLALGARGWFTS